jgi:hypothetical protein
VSRTDVSYELFPRKIYDIFTDFNWSIRIGIKPRPLLRDCIQKFPDRAITKYTLTTINTRWEATQRVMAAKLTRLNHKIAIQLYLVADSCTICCPRSQAASPETFGHTLVVTRFRWNSADSDKLCGRIQFPIIRTFYVYSREVWKGEIKQWIGRDLYGSGLLENLKKTVINTQRRRSPTETFSNAQQSPLWPYC